MAVTVRMASDDVLKIHPLFMPKHDGSEEALSRECADVEIDLNEGRRKRQRIFTPAPTSTTPTVAQPTSWQDQLKAAASIVPSTSMLQNQERESIEMTGESQVDNNCWKPSTEHADDESGSQQADGEDKSQHRLMMGFGGDGSNDLVGGPHTASEGEARRTPPKKMLRIRADGRLVSPKSTAITQEPKPKRQKRGPAPKIAPRTTLVVIMKYGKDQASCISVGQKIEWILSGRGSKSGPTESADKQETRQPVPPKATHPFFMRGAAPPSGQKVDTSSKLVDQGSSGQGTITQKIKMTSPRKARVISIPAECVNPFVPPLGTGLPTFGSDHARVARFPGAQDPIWPPHGMLHVGRADEPMPEFDLQDSSSQILQSRRKLKDIVQMPADEEVLSHYVGLVNQYQARIVGSQPSREFRRPQRLVMTGKELQSVVRQNISHALPRSLTARYQDTENPPSIASQSPGSLAPLALIRVFEQIANSRSAFDKFTAETQDWVQKYMPKCAEHVLQSSRDVILLRDWLKSLTILSVANHKAVPNRDSSVSSKRKGFKANKRKRKRAGDLDDFLISSDEEAAQMDEISDSEATDKTRSPAKKSVIRTGDNGSPGSGRRATNAVVISGPHGCGKTAAVYAVAQELGFEIFEINSGSRRSGKDILDKVGDMTRNHLVQSAEHLEATHAEDVKLMDEHLQEDLQSGRQGTVNSFFQPKASSSRTHRLSTKGTSATSPMSKAQSKKGKSHKQSLILLEEVDVLFEEDKAFWATTLDLIVNSKRPVIMTCTDESLLPLDDMAVHAIFRLTPPTLALATDYLILVACNEGHLLPRDAVSALFRSKDCDLRASLTELNFFCQMGIGDRKGGLEWMLLDQSPFSSHDRDENSLRVVSEGTYCTGMGWLSGNAPSSETETALDQDMEILSEAYNGWSIDLTAQEDMHPIRDILLRSENRTTDSMDDLKQAEETLEIFSAVDTFACCAIREESRHPLDATQPELTEKMRSDYPEGSTLLLTTSNTDHGGLLSSIAHAMRACAKRLTYTPNQSKVSQLTVQKAIDLMPQVLESTISEKAITKPKISVAFDAVARFSNFPLGFARGTHISCFDSPISVIAEDLSPYVRLIVSYDLRLEEQRRLLSSLLARPGREGKKTRTTRASRAALEGGNKASTRRERWFPRDTNFDLVLQTGGKGWQDIAWRRIQDADILGEGEGQDGSRQSSVATGAGYET